jgi:hypothetical protein
MLDSAQGILWFLLLSYASSCSQKKKKKEIHKIFTRKFTCTLLVPWVARNYIVQFTHTVSAGRVFISSFMPPSPFTEAFLLPWIYY